MKKFVSILTKSATVVAAAIMWIGTMIGLTVYFVWAGIKDLIDGYSVDKTALKTFAEVIKEVSKGIGDGLKEAFVAIDKEIGA